MNNQIAERLKQYALASTYEISCLTNMANVAKEMTEKGVAIPPGTIFSIVDKSTDPGTKDVDRVKTIERSRVVLTTPSGKRVDVNAIKPER